LGSKREEGIEFEVKRHLQEGQLNLARLKNLGIDTDFKTEVFLWFRLNSNEHADEFSKRLGDIKLRLVRIEHRHPRDENNNHTAMVCASLTAIPDQIVDAEFIVRIVRFAAEHSANFDRWSTKDVLNVRRAKP
jgi:hypothetical protein